MPTHTRPSPISRLALAAALILAGSVAAHGARAQIVTDGTAGSAGALTGPNYTIPQSLGTTNASGTTLLQSFSQFNLATGQTATFSGSNTLTSIIARVTGGTVSSIDGKLVSTAPNADFYLLNRAGILIGANAEIDVPAGLYISTADQLNFADNSSIPITATPVGTLSVAPIQSFGFVGGGTGDVTVHGTATANDVPFFGTFAGNLELIASDVSIDNRSILAGEVNSQINQLRIGSVGSSAGTVPMTGNVGLYGGTTTLNNVNNAPIANDPNYINLELGYFWTTTNAVNSTYALSGDGADTFLEGGNIYIQNNQVPTTNVPAPYLGIGSSGPNFPSNNIYIKGHNLTFNSTQIERGGALSAVPGTTGTLSIDLTGDLSLQNSTIYLPSFEGLGAPVRILAANMAMDNSSIVVDSGPLDAGSIDIRLTGNLTMQNGSSLSAKNIDNPPVLYVPYDPLNPGNAGTISITAAGFVSLTAGSSIDVSSNVLTGTNGGKAGSVDINAGSIFMDNSTMTATATSGNRGGGAIDLTTTGSVILRQSTIDASSESGGQGGTVTISAGGTLSMPVTVIAADSVCSACTPGVSPNGGKVTLTANSIDLPDSQITAKGDEGNGGTIDIAATQGLSADTTELSVASESSTRSGLHGGDMTLSGGQVSLTNDDIRLWNWMSGDRGGNVTVISAGDLYLGATSIDASSSFANDAGRSNFAFTAGGTFTLDGGTLLDPAGDIAITAANVALPALNSGSIDIRSVNATGGSVLVQAGAITAGGLVPNTPPGGQFDLLSGAGSQVILRAQNLTWGPYALASSQAYGGNTDSGNIALYANTLSVAGGLQSSAPAGQAGTITLGATDFTLGGGTVSTAGQTGGQIYLGGDASITLTSGTIRSAIAARGTSGTDGNVYIGLKLTDPTVVNAACDAACQALHPYSTTWTPGTHFGVPPVHDLGAASLAASGGIGQVIFGWSTVVPEDLRVTPVAFDDQDTADTDPRDSGIEHPGVPFIHPRESDPHSVCTAKASREARNSLAYLLVAIPAQSPGIAGPEVFGLHPSSAPPSSTLAACAPAPVRTAATAGAN